MLAVGEAFFDRLADDGLDAAAGEETGGVWLPDGPVFGGHLELGETLGDFFRGEDGVGDGAVGEGLEGIEGGLVAGAGEPEDAGGLEERGVRCGVELFVHLESLPGPAGVDFLGSVAHTQDSRFAAGGGAVVGGAVLIDEEHAAAAAVEGAGEPGAEDPGADDGEFEFWHGSILSCHGIRCDCIGISMRSVLVVFAVGMAWGQQKLFEPAETCAMCHTKIPAPAGAKAAAAVVGAFPLWAGSMMAHAGKDPYWKAKVRFEGDTTPAARAVIEDKCMRCHAPMQQYPLRAKGELARMGALNPEGAEGVSCTVCHKIVPEGLGERASFTGGFKINTENEIYGPHKDPFPMPMMHHAEQFPKEGRQILDSALCGSCHTVITPTLNSAGKQIGEFVEQAPYLEWLASDFKKSNVTCQSCHVPVLKDANGAQVEQYIAHMPHMGAGFFPPTRPRKPFGQHLFLGGNAQMLRVMGVETAGRAEEFLRGAVALEVGGRVEKGVLELAVEVFNKTGHKLPTGFPSRRMWLHVRVKDAGGAVVFESGAWDAVSGELVGAAARQEHRDRITRGSEVAVYEAAMKTPDGAPTMSLLRAAGYSKDNRILPLGFVSNAQIAPVGVAADADFKAGSDKVHYSVPVGGPVTVTVEALYQSVAPAHLEGLAFQMTGHRAPVVMSSLERVIR